MKISVTLDGQERVVRLTGEAAKALRKELTGALRESALSIARTARSAAPRSSGTLRSSIRTRTSSRFMSATVRAKAPHAAIIGKVGRKPGSKMPPPEAIVPWVRRHGRVFGIRSFKQVSRRRTRTARIAAVKSEAKELARTAFLVARAIAKRGIAARPFLEQAGELERPRFGARIREAVERSIRSVEAMP